MILKITLALAKVESGRRRIQARCKDLLKVTVKFIRRGTVARKEREKNFLFPVLEIRFKKSKSSISAHTDFIFTFIKSKYQFCVCYQYIAI
jgi:hypothetical protein